MHKMVNGKTGNGEFLPNTAGKVRKFTKIRVKNYSLQCGILEYTSYKSSKEIY